ncbi:amidase domain-containing protein [Bacillota bacterium Meth-B3]|nr:amidase domain-containing protein [Christensenellaceae bacterium]MEA5065421.1 amidase domain-containing protein [Eubacteriales bacterium]MEA5068623.1 amidase domain-containing protein [Christensenellaceae bacterium]
MAGYDRAAAIAYAHRWAFARNLAFGVFDEIGGDCANFTSQCLYAGGGVMNMAENGWYYRNMRDRSPSWTGVFFLNRFLVGNAGPGPYAEARPLEGARPGDVFLMAFVEGIFTHSGLVVAVQSPDPSGILIAAHTIDSDNRPLSTYAYEEVRILHILGTR